VNPIGGKKKGGPQRKHRILTSFLARTTNEPDIDIPSHNGRQTEKLSNTCDKVNAGGTWPVRIGAVWHNSLPRSWRGLFARDSVRPDGFGRRRPRHGPLVFEGL
jgi:hypothetical protein